MLRVYAADLHIHTCLSPCADLEMTPSNIVRKAVETALDMIAITDHNSGKNVRAVAEAASDSELTVIAGMEVQTREEVHLLCFFASLEGLEQWDAFIYDHLPDVRNDPAVFGYQPIVDREGFILYFESKVLINSLDLALEDVVHGVKDRGGICIPSHVDREAYSIIGQLGYIPNGLPIDGIEMVSDRQVPEPAGYEVIMASDAHFLRDIGMRKTRFCLGSPTVEEIQWALHGQRGRQVVGRS